MNDPAVNGWSLELVRPHMLWLLVLLVPLGWYYRRSLSDFPRWQRLAPRCLFLVRSPKVFVIT